MSFQKVLAVSVFGVAVWMSGIAPAHAQDASITGRGSYGTTTFSYICPPIAMFSHGEIAFDLRVTGKQGSPGEAIGSLRARCIGFDSHVDSIPIDTIVEMTETTASVRGSFDLAGAGYLNCVDKSGQSKTHIVLDIRLQVEAAGASSPATIHVSSAVPAGGISCGDPASGETVIFQNFDGGARPLVSGSISMTMPHPSSSD